MFFETTLLGSVELDVFVKLLLAALAGGLVGFEREKHPAGRPDCAPTCWCRSVPV